MYTVLCILIVFMHILHILTWFNKNEGGLKVHMQIILNLHVYFIILFLRIYWSILSIYTTLSNFNKNEGFKSAHAKYNKFTCILFYFILSYLNKNKCFRSICVFDKYLHMHFIALFYVNFIHFNNFKHWLKGEQCNK